jgi:hypothetical protein
MHLLRGELECHFINACQNISNYIMKTNLFNGRVIFSNTLNCDEVNSQYDEKQDYRIDRFNINFKDFYSSCSPKIAPFVIAPYYQIEGKLNFNLICPVIEEQRDHDVVLTYCKISLEPCEELKLELRKVGEEVVAIINTTLNAR